jgi:hypothetical protein
MSNVDEQYLVRFHRPIDDIGIMPNWKAARRSPACRGADVRILANRVDSPHDRELHIAGAARTSFVEIEKDFREIVCRAP